MAHLVGTFFRARTGTFSPWIEGEYIRRRLWSLACCFFVLYIRWVGESEPTSKSIFSGLQPKYGSRDTGIASLIPDASLASLIPIQIGNCMHKFASLVISGSMVSSVIMQLCNHASSLDSADVINPFRATGDGRTPQHAFHSSTVHHVH
jgi:hypothetical protein